MKPSTAKLYAMLPQSFVMRIDIVGGAPAGADILDTTGKATGIDLAYPGFAECFERLTAAGLVIHVGDTSEGTNKKGRISRLFFVCRCERAPKIDQKKTATPPKGATKGTDPS